MMVGAISSLLLLLFVLAVLALFAFIALITLRWLSKEPATPAIVGAILISGSGLFVLFLVLVIGSWGYWSLARVDSTEGATRVQTRVPISSSPVADGGEATIEPDPRAIASETRPSPPASWEASDLKVFNADVYIGMAQAAGPLARDVRAALEINRLLQRNKDDSGWIEPETVTIHADELNVADRSEVVRQFTAQLRDRFPDSTITVSDVNLDTASLEVFGNTVVAVLSVQNERREIAAWDQNATITNGELLCEARTGQGRVVVNTLFVDKPWVEDFRSFTAQYPGRRFIAGYSETLAPTEVEAKRMALHDARARLRDAGHVNFTLIESLASDRFVQKLSRPYGDVWRAAMLFDLSSTKVAMHAVTTMQAREAALQRMNVVATRKHHSIALVGVLFLLTAVLCVALNGLTQGYYRNRVGLGFSALTLGLIILSGLLLA